MIDWQAMRVQRAWRMYERAMRRNDAQCASQWLDQWRRESNVLIAETQFDNKEWLA